jgi:NAD(P) transhydrogenase subunit alpha
MELIRPRELLKMSQQLRPRMLIHFPKESRTGDARVAVVPEAAARLVKLGARVSIEPGIGANVLLPDSSYLEAGAELAGDDASAADLVVRLNKPAIEDVAKLASGSVHVSFTDPFNDPDLLRALAKQGVSAVGMEMIPRTTLAQKMDAMSSQANLAGYAAVVLAAERLDRILPMMMTPAGTIQPARVFVMGVGVAGLQAIATARRLGARVEAFDTRPAVEEQVKSLGAKFVRVDLGETGETAQGYARELTEEQLAKQREAMAAKCAESDIVIAAAQVFGRTAPILVTSDMIRRMRPGSIVVDLSVDTGGNVEGVVADDETIVAGVRIVGHRGFSGRVAMHASQMYAANVVNFVEHFWDREAKRLRIDLDDEIMRGSLVTHDGRIVHERFRDREEDRS